eukprot:TRINITY_DN2870_c0_g1_i1.p1 TRINITY_DN2870_c0_g1~~TRINITY_DN2870_c0_g1_i1.p1  ORF type:complete len:800 (-),score=178.66 TRINITY_DN2870_c0_g1_i1:74-2473(-)
MKLLLVALCYLSYFASAVEPSTDKQCGEDNKVVLSTTILKGVTVEDSQVIYVEGTQIVYMKVTQVGTFKSDIYRSSDYGKTWTKQTTPEILAGYAGEGIIRIFSARGNKAEDRITIYLLGYGNRLWVTSNGGSSYEHYSNVPAGITYLITHDMYPGLALAKRTSEDFSGDHELFLVTEFGKSWVKLCNIPAWSKVSWSKFPQENPQRIYLQLRSGASSAFESHTASLAYSDDWFKTTTVLPINNAYLYELYEPSRIAVISCVESDKCTHKKMFLSEDSGKSFHESSFPDHLHETHNETAIYPYEVTDDVIWAYVNRYCKGYRDFCYGDLYHTYDADKEFTLSLRYINYNDFIKYESLDGIYVANQYVTVDNAIENENDIRTLITFNKGGSWNVLKAPTRDSNNQPTGCFASDGCSLHLHGHNDVDGYFDFIYSVPNAVGLMVGSGNIGTVLSERDEANFYYSRDGGMEWSEVRKGRYVTEIGNHGTAVIAARLGKATNEFIYTIDEGDSWLSCQLGVDLDVANIRVSAEFSSTQFLVYGHKENDAYLIFVDLSAAYTGLCTDADFEIWSPKDAHGECFMGHTTQYTRRAVGKKCFLDEKHVHTTTTSDCSCGIYDYECAECFYRPTIDSPCQLWCADSLSSGQVPDPATDFCLGSNASHPKFYEVNMGYELIDEDTCNPNLPGSVKPKAVVSCEDWKALKGESPSVFPIPMPSKNTVAYGLIGFAVFVVLAVGGYYLWKTNDKVYACISNTFGIKSEERDLSYSQVNGHALVSSSDDDLTGVTNGLDDDDDDLTDSSAE